MHLTTNELIELLKALDPEGTKQVLGVYNDMAYGLCEPYLGGADFGVLKEGSDIVLLTLLD